jgi:hypothetical protein
MANKTTSKVLPAVLYGIGFGALFYTVGAIANGAGILGGISPVVMAALGFTCAAAIHLTSE